MPRIKVRISEETTGKVWERMHQEPEEAFLSFTRWRDTPESGRSIKKIFGADEDFESKRLRLNKWKKVYNWDYRVRVYLTHLDRIKQEENKNIFVQMAIRQAGNSKAYQLVIMKLHEEFLRRLNEKDENGTLERDLKKLSMEKLVNAIIRGAQVLPHLQEEERIAVGTNPEYNLTLLEQKDLKNMTDEELNKLYEEVHGSI